MWISLKTLWKNGSYPIFSSLFQPKMTIWEILNLWRFPWFAELYRFVYPVFNVPLYNNNSDGILCIGRIKSASIGCPLHFSFSNCDVRKLQNFSLFFNFVNSSVFLSNAFSIQNWTVLQNGRSFKSKLHCSNWIQV